MRLIRAYGWVVWLMLVVACGDRASTGNAPSLGDAPYESASKTSATPPAVDNSHGPKVTFLGDSITAGLHLPAYQAFPAVVQQQLAARGSVFRALNAGVSGDTSAGGLRRADWVLKQSPDIVVLELGGNDGLRGIPLGDIEQNLRGTVAKIRAHGAQVLLLGMRIPPNYGAEYTAGFAAIYPRLAQELSLPFVPYFMEGVAGVPELNLPDGLHPTPEGHVKLAEKIAGPLAALVQQAHAQK